MTNVIDILSERGFIEETTHEEALYEFVDNEDVTCYIGFDPTASSLHVGSLVPIMSLAHMQQQGHRPIALIGGGTGLVGDPSGKTEMRQLLTIEDIQNNAMGIKNQLSRFIDLRNGKALLLNNADWLKKLEYIPFLRDIGRHFSVNRMIKAESYKIRLDSDEGLNFIEFNYMILQAYDFLILFDNFGCRLQMGGSDQWGNIVAGVELVRRMRQATVFGITFPLITTSGGMKMGKTAKGAVWLDADRTTSYEYFQYWINTDDRDVERFLALFTFLPMDEIRAVGNIEGAELNYAKTVLAFETTLLVHGREEALKAYHAAAEMFGVKAVPNNVLSSSTIHRDEMEMDNMSSVPHSFIDINQLRTGIPAFKLFHLLDLTASGGAARRLIEQGGAYINGNRIDLFDYLVTDNDLDNSEILLRAGKKRFHKIKIRK
ncbi:MAG: tyrosine--tRNA ligase [Deltaproteobacteria bacterium]|nr:tyrosine--tRNA ligase [Deltaproteobacteria bacterium]